jgi:gamma-glutamyltranspeptidase/glutathione hydrolase
MAPTIVLKGGKLFLVLGAEGGPTIITTVADVLMGVVDYGLNIQQAVNAPRFHDQWLPDEIKLEKVGFSPDTVRILEHMGHKVSADASLDSLPGQQGRSKAEYWGDSQCIEIDPQTGERLGASDGRHNGKAVGF